MVNDLNEVSYNDRTLVEIVASEFRIYRDGVDLPTKPLNGKTAEYSIFGEYPEHANKIRDDLKTLMSDFANDVMHRIRIKIYEKHELDVHKPEPSDLITHSFDEELNFTKLIEENLGVK